MQRSSAWRCGRIAVAAVLVVWAGLCLFQPAPAQVLQPSAEQKLLVLTNGKVVEGQLVQTSGGYVMYKPTGQMFVPFTQVKFEAKNLTEAYQKLAQTLPERTATHHLSLARWCLSYQLYQFAQIEVQQALLLEPEREEARRMLFRLEELTRDPREVKPEKVQIDNGFLDIERKSLNGLSPDVAAMFVQRIQPIVLNRCGNASCHSAASGNSLPLVHVRIGQRSHRLMTERNLTAIMQQITPGTPSESPLYQYAMKEHGNGPLRNALDAGQLRELQIWIAAVAPSEPKRSPKATATPQRYQPPVTPQQGMFPSASQEPSLANYPVIPASGTFPANAPAVVTPAQQEFLNQILKEEQPDPFDPRQFNRQYAPVAPSQPTAAPASPSSFPTIPVSSPLPVSKPAPSPWDNSPPSQPATSLYAP